MSDSVWGDSTLVTGEAVALDMPAASLGPLESWSLPVETPAWSLNQLCGSG